MKNKLFILTILIALLSVSCEDFLDVNVDPNNPVVVTPDLVLPVGQAYTAKLMQQDRGVNHLGNMFMYNWSETYGFSWYDEEFKYLVTTTFYDNLFDDSYSSALKQYEELTKYGEEYGHYAAIGEIMKAYHFQLLVDLYGDIPYTQALMRGGNATPAYDNQEVIYDDLLVKLSDAIAAIKAADENPMSVAPGEDDIMFGGNTTKWIQFANTIKVRILTRVSDVKPADFISAEMAVINEEGSGFISSDVAVNPGYLAEVGKQNPYWDELGADVSGTVRMSNDATCATQYILDYLAGTNDARLNYMYEEPEDGHKGVEQGSNPGDDYAASKVSNIGVGHLKGATMDAVIFTLAESNLNMAELAFKGFGGDPAVYYEAGIVASFKYLMGDALGETEGKAYVAKNGYASAPNKIEAIITQKWLATNGITAEQSWFDYSRTGYPSDLPVSLLATTADRPVRLVYPSSEITANSKNVPGQKDAFTDKIFWGK